MGTAAAFPEVTLESSTEEVSVRADSLQRTSRV